MFTTSEWQGWDLCSDLLRIPRQSSLGSAVSTREVHQGNALLCKREKCKFPAIIRRAMELLMKLYSLVIQPTKAIKPSCYSRSYKTDYSVLFLFFIILPLTSRAAAVTQTKRNRVLLLANQFYFVLHAHLNYARYFNSSQVHNTKKEKIKEINYFWNIKQADSRWQNQIAIKMRNILKLALKKIISEPVISKYRKRVSNNDLISFWQQT